MRGDKIFILFFNREYPFEVLEGIDMKRIKQDEGKGTEST